jgi:hydrogenase nickel incorporation protein HypA/HybF
VHELSIACSLVDLAVEAAERAGAAKVVAVKVVVGAFSGVSAEALLFSYDVAAAGTRLEGSRLELRTLPLVIHCAVCDADRELPSAQAFRCPVCQTPSGDLRQGRELYLEALEVEEPPPEREKPKEEPQG